MSIQEHFRMVVSCDSEQVSCIFCFFFLQAMLKRKHVLGTQMKTAWDVDLNNTWTKNSKSHDVTLVYHAKKVCFPSHIPHSYILYILFTLYLYFIHLEFPAAKLSILGNWFGEQNATLHIISIVSCVTWNYLKILSSKAIQVWFLLSVLHYKPLPIGFSSYSWLKLPLRRGPAACSASWAFELMLLIFGPCFVFSLQGDALLPHLFLPHRIWPCGERALLLQF